MEKIKNFVKQNLLIILFALCGVLVVSGILVIVFGGGGAEGWLRGLFTAFGIVLILIGCALVFYATLIAKDEQANFFLYDNKRKTNIPVEELDFERVNRQMTVVMANLVDSDAVIWTKDVFTEKHEEIYDEDGSLVPLVAYKILYDLADRASESVWNLYLASHVSIVDSIVSALEQNGDSELGKAFKFLHENANGSYERTEKFLLDNRKYIQNKMVKYVKANIEKF